MNRPNIDRLLKVSSSFSETFHQTNPTPSEILIRDLSIELSLLVKEYDQKHLHFWVPIPQRYPDREVHSFSVWCPTCNETKYFNV